MIMNNTFRTIFVLLFIAGFTITSCDNFLEPSVDQNKPTEEAIQSVSDLRAVAEGMYDDLSATGLYGRDYLVSIEVMSDNALSNGNSGRFLNQDDFSVLPTDAYPNDVWNTFYQVIADANLVINSNIETNAQINHIKGQAYAMRAFAHMNLLLAFGQQYVSGGNPDFGVPYVTVYNDESEFYPERDPISTVWSNIGDDFSEAVSLMDPAFNESAVYLTTFGAQAMLSRYHLYTGNYDGAITAADYIINNGSWELLADSAALKDTWESGSGPNSVFEIAMTNTDNRGTNSIARIYRATNYGDVEATDDLYAAYAADDDRLALFTVNTSGVVRMNSKYYAVSGPASGSDNIRVIRYAEVLLNKAEALAKRGEGTDLVDALAIINDISSKRGSSRIYTSATQEDVIADVLAERRLELAMEGHRLYDLLRHELGVPAHEGGQVGGQAIPFGDTKLALPIPQGEIDANSNIDQNEGFDN